MKTDEKINILLTSTIKVTLSTIPVLGLVIDEILFNIGDRIRGERLEKLSKKIEEKVKSMDQTMLDREYLESDDFYDITREVISKAIRTKNKDKLNAFANVLMESIFLKREYELDLTSIYLNFIEELTEIHILVMKYLKDNFSNISSIKSIKDLCASFAATTRIKIDKYEFYLILKDLESKSLIRISDEVEDLYGGPVLIAAASDKSPGVSITPIGNNLIKYILTK